MVTLFTTLFTRIKIVHTFWARVTIFTITLFTLDTIHQFIEGVDNTIHTRTQLSTLSGKEFYYSH